MDKKKLTKDSVTSWPVYVPNGMSIAEFEWWLDKHGFRVNNASKNKMMGQSFIGMFGSEKTAMYSES